MDAKLGVYLSILHFQCEFMSTGHGRHIKANFSKFEDELITKLDALVGGGCGDHEYKELFDTTLR